MNQIDLSVEKSAHKNKESELLVRAPAQLASPLSVYLAKIWGFARLGPKPLCRRWLTCAVSIYVENAARAGSSRERACDGATGQS